MIIRNWSINQLYVISLVFNNYNSVCIEWSSQRFIKYPPSLSLLFIPLTFVANLLSTPNPNWLRTFNKNKIESKWWRLLNIWIKSTVSFVSNQLNYLKVLKYWINLPKMISFVTNKLFKKTNNPFTTKNMTEPNRLFSAVPFPIVNH